MSWLVGLFGVLSLTLRSSCAVEDAARKFQTFRSLYVELVMLVHLMVLLPRVKPVMAVQLSL